MKVKITVQADIEVEFDENSQDFKSLFDNYNQYFNDCTLQEFAENIASQVARYGIDENIEGVGLVQRNGVNQKDWSDGGKEIKHFINVKADFNPNNVIDFEIVESEIEN